MPKLTAGTRWSTIFATSFLSPSILISDTGRRLKRDFCSEITGLFPLILQIGSRQETLFRPYTDDLFKNRGRHEPEFFDIKGTNNRQFGFAWVCVNDARETIKDVKLRGLLLKKFGFFHFRPTISRTLLWQTDL